jgi:glycerol-3-phosphate dehydrogenase
MQTQVLIIGGGATGTGVARDLALRGIDTILVEKNDINAGASGGNHGLLHSGARYVASDPAAARECREEGELLKRLAPHCIEDTGGLFVALAGDDERYLADFQDMCAKCDIPAEALDVQDARDAEPHLAADIIAAYRVPDATIDPFKLSLNNLVQASQLGSRVLRHTKVISFEKCDHKIRAVRLVDTNTDEPLCIEPEIVVNASGSWCGEVAAMAGAAIGMVYSKGSLLVTQNRLSDMVINRLRKAADGDIVVPGGTVSILGTTSQRVDSSDRIQPEIHEIDFIIDECAAMLPVLSNTRYIRAYCGVRPLISSTDTVDDRKVSRGFVLIDHRREGIANFISITGGKLTTFRLMAEKTADLVCRKLGTCQPCRTRVEPLPDSVQARWTEPGLAPNHWLRNKKPDDTLLCECEMVSKSIIDRIVTDMHSPKSVPILESIGLRSRVGKGPCQGTFCSQRVAAHLYDRSHISGIRGKVELRSFLQERWRGLRPLLWDVSLVQAELMEAMHCGLLGLELDDGTDRKITLKKSRLLKHNGRKDRKGQTCQKPRKQSDVN